MIFIGYKKCSTCRNLEKMMEEKGIAYKYREIDKDNPSAEELKTWHEKSGLPLKRFFNSSGIIYREEKIKDKLPNMTEDEQYTLLSTNGKLVKRPILLDGDKIFVGPDVKKYIESK